MSSFRSNNSFVTKDYVLNHGAVYGDCKPLVNQYVSNESQQPGVFSQNCEPRIFYNCHKPYNRYWKEPKNMTSDQIVYQNIQRGGMICDFKPRTEINTKIGSRFLSDPTRISSRPPCDYVKDVETGFYLRHGKSSVSSNALLIGKIDMLVNIL